MSIFFDRAQVVKILILGGPRSNVRTRPMCSVGA